MQLFLFGLYLKNYHYFEVDLFHHILCNNST